MQNSMRLFNFIAIDRKHLFGPKNQNCQFKLKFGTLTYLNIQYLMMIFIFSVLHQKTLFGQIGLSIHNCFFQKKFGTCTNLNMQNSMVMFTFFYFRPEIHFLGKFHPKNQNCLFQLNLGT